MEEFTITGESSIAHRQDFIDYCYDCRGGLLSLMDIFYAKSKVAEYNMCRIHIAFIDRLLQVIEHDTSINKFEFPAYILGWSVSITELNFEYEETMTHYITDILNNYSNIYGGGKTFHDYFYHLSTKDLPYSVKTLILNRIKAEHELLSKLKSANHQTLICGEYLLLPADSYTFLG